MTGRNTVARAAGLGGIGLAIMIAAWPSFAQDVPKPGATGIADGVQYTTENVDPAAPFGEINVDEAGTTMEGLINFVPGLPQTQLRELQARCFVIRSSPGRFPFYATQFCRNMIAADIAGL